MKGLTIKRTFFTALFFLLLILSTYVVQASQEFAIPSHCLKPFRGKAIGDKVYLHPGMAQIGPNGIIVQINGELVPVPIIESDPYGVFVRAQHVAGKIKPGDWCCTTCWNWNSSNRTICYWCGADRED